MGGPRRVLDNCMVVEVFKIDEVSMTSSFGLNYIARASNIQSVVRITVVESSYFTLLSLVRIQYIALLPVLNRTKREQQRR